MKEPEKLIRKYYAENDITHSSPLLFMYVKKCKSNGAIIEYYAAKYGHIRGGKGNDMVTKLVMKFNPDTNRHSISDSVIRYQSWSRAILDHLIYDFRKEMTGCNNYPVNIGSGKMYSCGNWDGEVMPTSEIPLNDFSGTKYEYCKYMFKDESISSSRNHSFSYWAKNPYGNLPDYLKKFNINPRAMEMFAANGIVKYMCEPFLVRLRDDKPFADWYKRHARMTMGWSIPSIEAMARKEIGITDFLSERIRKRRIEKMLKQRRIEREHREEIRRKKEAEERERLEKQNRSKRIRDLYNKLKSICRKYGAYEVFVPKTEAEMRKEGERMHNCIGKCYPSRQGINAIVVFLHKNGKPCVDIEIDMKTFAVKQCRAICNKDADIKEIRLAKRISEKIEKIYKMAA